jgi:hypothetical protein
MKLLKSFSISRFILWVKVATNKIAHFWNFPETSFFLADSVKFSKTGGGVMPRFKDSKKALRPIKGSYLFNHKAQAKIFRAKFFNKATFATPHSVTIMRHSIRRCASSIVESSKVVSDTLCLS